MHEMRQPSAAKNSAYNRETKASLQNPHRPVHLGDSTSALNCLSVLLILEMTVNIAFGPVEHKYNADYTDT